MKLNANFITRTVEGTQVIVPIGDSGFNGIITGNETSAFIVNLLKNGTTEAALVDAMAQEYDAPIDVIRSDVREILDKLRKIGALDE